MKWIDGHCDVLYKLWKYPEESLDFYGKGHDLDVTYAQARQAGVLMQVFAIFVPENVPRSQSWQVALEQVDLFYEKVVRKGGLQPVRTSEELNFLSRENRMGGLLSLEGADALQGSLRHLRILSRLGVRQVGLTWNYANEAADGIEEERGGGLTRFGRELVREMQRLRMVLDVSHLSVRGFWEVMEENLPVIASHSNARAICSHRRNLMDDQIRALVDRKGLIGITFVPKFVCDDPDAATVDDLLRHIEHICSLGGEERIAFGSDYDGIEQKILGLEHIGNLVSLGEELLKRYPEHLVKRWTWTNWYEFYAGRL
ncbi:diguanylate cyclase [Kroppenstedtia guangzhouensis]|uniref:Diguanylate cyclase n=1 Tax=Kroppenstedtia guangzhouensis TaxID=1274356 RepID=A0ABQ1FZW4_9BACL|nr:dipeptidase [Kroppenstedtia guangzhouensis]GGA34719.1 diguanylate cyclase [Kroppenstedtia guangzhouensis]